MEIKVSLSSVRRSKETNEETNKEKKYRFCKIENEMKNAKTV